MDEGETLTPAENLEQITGDETSQDVTEPESDNNQSSKLHVTLKIIKTWLKSHKTLSLALGLIIIFSISLAMPYTHYAIIGKIITKDYVLYIKDNQTKLPVSEAEVSFKGARAFTGADGKVRLKSVKIGKGELVITKNFYNKTKTFTTLSLTSNKEQEVNITPNGRQVPIIVTNKITGKPLGNAVLNVLNTKVKTNENGEATIVLPPNQSTVEGEVTLSGYNNLKANVKISHLAIRENSYKLTPSGSIYFLQKTNNKIDLMKSNLDGSDKSILLPATGKENKDTMRLNHNADWKYLSFVSSRDGHEKLFLIETANDSKIITLEADEQKIIEVIGFIGQKLIYKIDNLNIPIWNNARQELKSYDTGKKTTKIIASSVGEGVDENNYAKTDIEGFHSLSNGMVFRSIWLTGYSSSYRLTDKKHLISKYSIDSGEVTTLIEYDAKKYSLINSVKTKLNEILFRAFHGAESSYYEYKNDKITDIEPVSNEKFYTQYLNLIMSPTNENTLWSQSVGDNRPLFVGDKNGKELFSIKLENEFDAYGWFSEKYILVSRNNNELFVLPSNGLGTTGNILKISDYFVN